MRETNNLHVVDTSPLITPTQLKRELPISECAAETVAATRDTIRAILLGEDNRLLAVVGPCSIHDVDAARDYAERRVAEHYAEFKRLAEIGRTLINSAPLTVEAAETVRRLEREDFCFPDLDPAWARPPADR